LSPSNTSLQGDQRPQQVLCGSRRPTSLTHGVGGQNLHTSYEELNCYPYKCRLSNKFDGLTTDVKEPVQFRNHTLSWICLENIKIFTNLSELDQRPKC
jgi:hypothetical protein